MSFNFREQFEASQLYLQNVSALKHDAADSATLSQQKLLVAKKPFVILYSTFLLTSSSFYTFSFRTKEKLTVSVDTLSNDEVKMLQPDVDAHSSSSGLTISAYLKFRFITSFNVCFFSSFILYRFQ